MEIYLLVLLIVIIVSFVTGIFLSIYNKIIMKKHIKESKIETIMSKTIRIDSVDNLGYLNMFLFLSKTPEDLISINKIIKSISEKDLLEDKIIVVSEAFLDEKNLEKYLEYKKGAVTATPTCRDQFPAFFM